MKNGIMVNPAELSTFGNFLISSAGKVNQDLVDINKALQTVGTAWSDQVGVEYAAKFNGFITASMEICQLMSKVGNDVSGKANDYAQIITNALKRMG